MRSRPVRRRRCGGSWWCWSGLAALPASERNRGSSVLCRSTHAGEDDQEGNDECQAFPARSPDYKSPRRFVLITHSASMKPSTSPRLLSRPVEGCWKKRCPAWRISLVVTSRACLGWPTLPYELVGIFLH